MRLWPVYGIRYFLGPVLNTGHQIHEVEEFLDIQFEKRDGGLLKDWGSRRRGLSKAGEEEKGKRKNISIGDGCRLLS